MKAKKILSIIGCFTLTAVTCVCMLFSVGCYKNEPKKEADGLIITPGEVQGDMISLLTQGPTDGTTEYTLTVVLNADCPDDMKAIDWSVAWKNSSSEWATGKVVTDYVTVTPTADGALTAKVKKVAAFGEQVIVTVTSRVLPELKATATVDCLMEFTLAVHSITIKLGDVFSFYPNPTINEIILSYSIENDETIVVSISNLQGKTTTLFSGIKRSGEYIEHYSLTDFPSGMYLISIMTSRNQYIKKIIKL